MNTSPIHNQPHKHNRLPATLSQAKTRILELKSEIQSDIDLYKSFDGVEGIDQAWRVQGHVVIQEPEAEKTDAGVRVGTFTSEIKFDPETDEVESAVFQSVKGNLDAETGSTNVSSIKRVYTAETGHGQAYQFSLEHTKDGETIGNRSELVCKIDGDEHFLGEQDLLPEQAGSLKFTAGFIIAGP